MSIDENLSWKNHIAGITKTISRNTGMINKLKIIIPERILRTLYCTPVLPYVNYGILIWGAERFFFTKLSDIHNYDTRNKSNYRVSK